MVALAKMGAIVSDIRTDRTSADIAKFHNIPISTVKKVAKLYNNFLVSGGKDKDLDIQRKVHKRCVTPRGWRSSKTWLMLTVGCPRGQLQGR